MEKHTLFALEVRETISTGNPQEVRTVKLKIHSSGCTADIERALWGQGYHHIAGVDEVGRGAWAGPVVTAAVMFSPERIPEGINDSKQLSPVKREILSEIIQTQALAFAFGEEQAATIDRINILEATRLAMRTAIDSLAIHPTYLLIDAVILSGCKIPQQGIIRGDTLSVSIAAASILAKVYRDQMMIGYDKIYPGYGFARHKGYGTPEHRKSLERLGPCPLHRCSFRGVLSLPRLWSEE